MGKRVPDDSDGAAAYRKRQKITHDVPTGEEVADSEQLRYLLTFDQDLGHARHGLQSFKKLLDDIVADHDDRKQKLDIVHRYLEAVKPRDTTEDAIHLNDIMEMWSFATQVNNDGVMSSVAVVLALLLHVVSESLQLVPYGLGICRTLLQERQLKSLAKNLSSEKSKAFVLSPTYRLLREAGCLDGGAFAKQIVRSRSSTFTSLGRNLEVGFTGDPNDENKRASVRTNAVRFLLSCIKYVHTDGRKEILSQKDLLSHVTFMMKTDPPHVVVQIIDTLQTYILKDEKIPRDVKFRSFNTKTLLRFLALYTYSSPLANDAEESDAVIDRAHRFLLFTCTTAGAGVLYPSTGFYPKEGDGDDAMRRIKGSSKHSKRDIWEGKYSDEVPIYNFALSEFSRKLRPWSSIKHSELLVAIFKAAPELVADYFLNNRTFTFEPKLSMTWIGYSAFLFNTMSIALPNAFGDRSRFASIPPPTSILLANVLPLPINQKVLTRCLTPKSNLTSLFAMRILIIALEKLDAACKMQDESQKSSNKPLWAEANRRLVDAFCQRVPDLKEIVRCYKGIPAANHLQKTLASRLIRLYYEVIPQVALAANFDVSPFFVALLRNVEKGTAEAGDKALSLLELENLVSIASYSPGMRWYSKLDGLDSSSAFTALLKVLCGGDMSSFSSLQTILEAVAVESQLVSKNAGLRPLIKALVCSTKSPKDMDRVWAFLDNSLGRCGTSPIKYLEILSNDVKQGKADPKDGSWTLLGVAFAEQVPFLTDAKAKSSVAKFLALYFNALHESPDSDFLITILHERVQRELDGTKLAKLGDSKLLKALNAVNLVSSQEPTEVPSGQETSTLDESVLEAMLHVPLERAEDTTTLTRWAAKSPEDLLEDGWAAKLIGLLGSEHMNIRKEALSAVLKMAAKIKESSYEENEQIWLLLSEAAESSRDQIDHGPAPSAFVAFASHALDILRNPLHPLYPKVNTFLTRSPIWSQGKLPLAHDILHGEPSEDDRYYAELTWLLTYLLDALRTSDDLANVFHKKRWFEKILALAANPYLRTNLRLRVLRIVYRATCIETGSTTLITRFGVLSWLDTQRAAVADSDSANVAGDDATAGLTAAVYAALMRRVWNTCDRDRVLAWSRGGVTKLLEGIGESRSA